MQLLIIGVLRNRHYKKFALFRGVKKKIGLEWAKRNLLSESNISHKNACFDARFFPFSSGLLGELYFGRSLFEQLLLTITSHSCHVNSILYHKNSRPEGVSKTPPDGCFYIPPFCMKLLDPFYLIAWLVKTQSAHNPFNYSKSNSSEAFGFPNRCIDK